MTKNVRDATSAILGGRSRVMRFWTRFEVAWQQPRMDAMLLAWWHSMDDAMKAELRKADPERFAKAEQAFKRMEADNA